MKYSICNIQLLPKAVDLRKKALDEFPLNMAIVLPLLIRNALINFLADFQFIPRSQGLSTEWHARNSVAGVSVKQGPDTCGWRMRMGKCG